MKAVVKRIGNEIAVSCTVHRQQAKIRKPKNPSNERTSQSIAAAKSRINEIVECNDWQWTATFEFSPKTLRALGGDDTAIKKVKQWFANLKKRVPEFEHLSWLVVPEPHSDRRRKLHLHGFLSGIPSSALIVWSKIRGRKPAAIRARLKAGDAVYNWPAYQNKFGFCLLVKVNGVDNAKNSKNKWKNYITKSLQDSARYQKSGQSLYYCSRGLHRAEVVATGYISAMAEKCIRASAEKSYSHRTAPGKPIYGHTYILADNAAQAQKIKQTIIGEA